MEVDDAINQIEIDFLQNAKEFASKFYFAVNKIDTIDEADLADYLHCSQVAYSYYELGKRDIPTSILIQLANFYHTSIDYLLNQTDEKQPYPKK